MDIVDPIEQRTSPVDLRPLTSRLLREYADDLPAQDVLAAIVDAHRGYTYLGLTVNGDLEALVRRELDLLIAARRSSGIPNPAHP